MRYGLRSDNHVHSSNKKWKISMENDIAALKLEVTILKRQLKSSLDIINSLLFDKVAKEHVKDCSINTTPAKEDGNNRTQNNDFKILEFKIDIPMSHPGQFFITTPKITAPFRPTSYKDPGEHEGYKVLNCITAMPEYKDWSFEELRLAFYKAAYPKQHQLFYDDGLEGVLTGTRFIKYSPSWDYDPVIGKCVCLHCITTNTCCQNKSLEELRLEDYTLKKNTSSQVTPLVEDTMRENPTLTFSIDNVTSSQKQEALLGHIMLELRKMNENFTSVNSQLSSMEANISEMSSQMSVMDSRLSAVDMFVTMQRVDNKWQGLTSRLQTLENTSTVDQQIKQVQPLPLSIRKLKHCINNLSQGFSSTSTGNPTQEVKVLIDSKSAAKKLGNLSQEIIFIASEDTILVSNLPKKIEFGPQVAEESAEIQRFDLLNVNSNVIVNLEKNSEERNSHSDCQSRNSYNENSSFHVIEEGSKLKCNNQTSIIDSESTTITPKAFISLSPENECKDLRNSKISSTCKTECVQESNLKDIILNPKSYEISSDIDSEFVIINKSDIDNLCEYGSGDVENRTLNGTTDYKICNDITEYLEVHLGKRKDLVYEFGFEAKPDSPLDSVLESSVSCNSPSQDANNSSTNFSSGKDDSFLSYIGNLIKSISSEHQNSPDFPASRQAYNNLSEKKNTAKNEVNIQDAQVFISGQRRLQGAQAYPRQKLRRALRRHKPTTYSLKLK